MNLEELADEAKKENIISIAAMMSKVDGKIHANEFVYLLKLGFSLGLSDEKVREIIHSNEEFIFVPKSEQDRVTILYYLIFLIKVDGAIDKEEVNLMHHFGLKLGFSPLLISNVIDVIKSQTKDQVAPDSILNEVNKYLN